jgi:hypothetical protein
MEPEKKERINRKDDKTPSTKKGAFIDAAKSSYEPGKVHEISFKRMESDAGEKSGLHSRKVITIYRKLSEQEYNTLKKARIFFTVVPSDASEHEMDVYNIEVPKELYGSRKGPIHEYFVYSSKEQINALSAKNKTKLKLELIPLTQIVEKGIGRTQMTNNDIKSFLVSSERRLKQKKTTVFKPAVTNKQEDDFTADDRKEASNFTTKDYVDRLFNKAISLYDKFSKNANPIAKEMFYDVMDEYFKKLGEFTDDPYIMAAVLDLIKPKLSSKTGLFKKFVDYFDKKVGPMKEMSTTGTGAFATPGEGEGMATKYAFAGAGADPKKKKKRIPTMKNEALSNYKMFLKHIFNINN